MKNQNNAYDWCLSKTPNVLSWLTKLHVHGFSNFCIRLFAFELFSEDFAKSESHFMQCFPKFSPRFFVYHFRLLHWGSCELNKWTVSAGILMSYVYWYVSVERDMKDRGRQLDQILHQYITYVKPAFEEFCLPVSCNLCHYLYIIMAPKPYYAPVLLLFPLLLPCNIGAHLASCYQTLPQVWWWPTFIK